MQKLILGGMFLAAVVAQGQVAVTIYNDNLAVVRDVFPVQLDAGETVVKYDRATAQVMPDSVVLRDVAGEAAFAIREQSYRNDPISQGLLLSLFEGKELTFVTQFQNGDFEEVEGLVIRSGYLPGGGGGQSPVIETSEGIRFSLPGQPLFPSLGDDSILRPTLSWTLGGEAQTSFEAQVSYLTRGLTWEAAYNLVAPEEGETVTLSGWITAKNQAGTGFKNAQVKLVAGDVNVLQDASIYTRSGGILAEDAFADAEVAVSEKAFDDFHLYTLPRPLTLRDQETKQVEFLRSAEVKASKLYVYDGGSQYRYRGGRNTNPLQAKFPKDVAIYWIFENTEENGLGVPLPAGKVRFYREDSDDGNLEFVGENRIDHIPQKEEVKVYTGNAFDLVGGRKVANFERHDRRKTMKETVEVTVKNRSKKPATILIREHLWRWSNWELETKSEFEKVDSNTVEFEVVLEPDEEKVVSYLATYTW